VAQGCAPAATRRARPTRFGRERLALHLARRPVDHGLMPIVRVCPTIGLLFALMIPSVASAQDSDTQPPPPPPPPAVRAWTGAASVGLALTRGNSDSLTGHAGLDLTHDRKRGNVLKVKGLHLRGEQEGSATLNRTTAEVRDEHTFSPHAFAFGQVGYLHDTFKLIDYLVAPTMGIGWKAVDTDRTKFGIDAGAGVVWEKNPGADARSSGAVSAAEKIEHKLTATATLRHSTTALWKLDDLADGLYTFSGAIATRISERFSLSVEFVDTFKSRPPTEATRRNDLSIVTALTATY
jgi:putative salt-induced outer membrane protein YdiY